MDRVVPRSRHRRLAAAAGVVACLVVLGWAAVATIPRGYPVERDSVRIATVRTGVFRDELTIRATSEPLVSVMLDATEGGRVESIHAKDGDILEKGALIVRLSNPLLQQQVLARAAEVAQQTANLAAMRSALETSRADHQRRIADIEYELARAEREHARDAPLAEKELIARAAEEDSRAAVDQQRRRLSDAVAARDAELKIRGEAVAQLHGMQSSLSHGLSLLQRTMDALNVVAPVAGRLTEFRLQVGESVKPGDRVGRVDVPTGYKLVASADEFYLNRVKLGVQGTVAFGGKDYAVVVARINPQVKDGRFEAELQFDREAPPALQPGQSADVRLSLGEPSQAVLVPDEAFFRDTGGSWVYVLAADGSEATRRTTRFGRRASGELEVLDGLRPGDRIIVSTYAPFADAERLRLK